MELNETELKEISKWKAQEIAKIEALNLPDDKKQNRLEIIENTQFHKIKPLTVKEVAPHQWEAY